MLTPQWLLRRPKSDKNAVERGARAIVLALKDADEGLATKQLALAAGLPVQTASVVLHTLRQLQLADRVRDPDTRLQMWRWRGDKPALRRSAAPSSGQPYTIDEAAALTGLTPKALRRRIERGTLGYFAERRRRLIPHAALESANLLGGRADKTEIERNTRRVIYVLATMPREKTKTTRELQLEMQPLIYRPVVETTLATLRALRLVDRSYNESFKEFEWRWTGPSV